MNMRKVNKIVTGEATVDGAGVKLTRVLGRATVDDFDPFLMLDAFDSTNPKDYVKGFPWHPHRGIETVTYLIHGDIEHGDSLGNRGSINDGCCQWMTAGGGIIHQEMPKETPWLLGLQLWINLPQKDKMTRPAYNDIRPDNIPKLHEAHADVAIISGEYKGIKADMQGEYVKTLYLDIDLKPGAEWELEADKEAKLFVYILKGSAAFEDSEKEIPEKCAVLMTYGDTFKAVTKEGCRFILAAAKPLREPVAWGGPIVMNTRQEVLQAFKEIDDGTFEKGCDKANRDYYQKT